MENNPNQLSLDVIGCSTGLSSFAAVNSSSRLVMLGGHLSQMLVMEGATKKRIISGAESEYSNTTFKVEMPCDGKIIAVINKYPTGVGINSFKKNTETIVIYEHLKSRGVTELGMLTLSSHHCLHQSFGFKYQQTDAVKSLIPGNIILKGTVFSQSPNVTEDGNYKFGIEANVAFMSIPQIIEDGFVVSESFCERMATTSIGTRQVSWGKKKYPINLYGDENHYKPFPDVGEKIKDNGLLFALRDYDELLAPSEMDLISLREYDPVFDTLVFAENGAEIINVNVYHDHNLAHPPTPIGMEAQTRRYANAQSEFYRKVIAVYQKEYSKDRNIKLTKDLHRLIVEAQSDDPKFSDKVVTRTYRAAPLDDWMVEIKYAVRTVPTIGFKLTGLAGNGSKLTKFNRLCDK